MIIAMPFPFILVNEGLNGQYLQRSLGFLEKGLNKMKQYYVK